MAIKQLKKEARKWFDEKFDVYMEQNLRENTLKELFTEEISPASIKAFIDSLITKAYEEGINLILENIQAKLNEEKKQSAYNKNMHIRSILGSLEDEILSMKSNL